jgi:hypothetical protein
LSPARKNKGSNIPISDISFYVIYYFSWRDHERITDSGVFRDLLVVDLSSWIFCRKRGAVFSSGCSRSDVVAVGDPSTPEQGEQGGSEDKIFVDSVAGCVAGLGRCVVSFVEFVCTRC